MLSITCFVSKGQEVKWVGSGAGDRLMTLNGEIDKGYSVISSDNAIYLTGLVTGNEALIQDTIINKESFCFLAKYDTVGGLNWIKELPGWYRTDVALNSKNEILVTGQLIWNSYIHKYDSNGNLLWEKLLFENPDNLGFYTYAIEVDSEDAIYVSGIYYSYYDHFTIADTLVEGLIGQDHAFILKFNSDGEFQWISTTNGGDYSTFRDIKIDNNNNIVGIGDFRTYKNDSLLVGNIWVKSNSETINSSPSQDIVCAKYDTEGNFLWMKHFGGIKQDWGNKLSINSLNEIKIVGTFHDTIDIENINLVSKGSYDIYMCSLNSQGQVLWAESAGGLYGYPSSFGVEAGRSITTDLNNNIYISGSFLDSAIFGKGENEVVISTNYSSFTQGGFIAKYSNEGKLIWVKNLTGRKSTIEDIYYYKTNITLTGSFFPDVVLLRKRFPITYPLTNNFFIAQITVNTTSQNEINDENSVKMYPNPTNGVLKIDEKLNEKISDILVYNVYGDNVTSNISYNQQSNIDLTKLRNGIYILIINTNDGIVTKKIIKQNY